jgi:hypothetical protein
MEFDNVPVPRKWVTKVYAYIAKLEADEEKPAADDHDDEASPVVDREGTNGNWPEDELARFAKGETHMHPTIIGMLDLLVDQPGTQVSLSDMAKQLDITREVLRGRLAALTRHLKSNYAFAKLGWPMQWKPHFDVRGKRETWYYISSEQAQRWRAARER